MPEQKQPLELTAHELLEEYDHLTHVPSTPKERKRLKSIRVELQRRLKTSQQKLTELKRADPGWRLWGIDPAEPVGAEAMRLTGEIREIQQNSCTERQNAHRLLTLSRSRFRKVA